MKINRIWIEYEDEHGDRYMAPAAEMGVVVVTVNGVQKKSIKAAEAAQPITAQRSRGRGHE
jgi:hypothetical protein